MAKDARAAEIGMGRTLRRILLFVLCLISLGVFILWRIDNPRVERFRMAVFSCSNFGFGWFNAYAHAVEANDVDLALHLGDYIYEYGGGTYPSGDQRHPERIVEISWGKSDSGTYPVDLTLHAFDRNGLIRDVTAVLADDGANVLHLKSRTDKKTMQVIMDIGIEISDLPTLSTAITRLEQVSNVVSVRRKS